MRQVGAIALLVGAGWFPLAAETPTSPPSLLEKVSTRLEQLEVTIVGPDETIASLTAADFALTVAGRDIKGLHADSACPVPSRPDEAPPRLRPSTFLLYFDGSQMTPEGRNRAIGLARGLVPQLLSGGGRAIVVSNDRLLITYAGPTSSVDELRQALDRLGKDGTQVDAYAFKENIQVDQMLRTLERAATMSEDKVPKAGSELKTLEIDGARNRLLLDAGRFQKEETQRVRRSLERLSIALDRLAPADPPRILVYFADTLRLNPGDHYFRILRETPNGRRLFEKDKDITRLKFAPDPFGIGSFFDRMVAVASARGARVYTIQAAEAALPDSRVRDARNALGSLARENGGKTFGASASAESIAGQISRDSACVYTLSFDPAGLPEDRPLPVEVFVGREGVKAETRGTLVVASRESRLSHAKLAALYGESSGGAEVRVRASLIPLGYDKGKFSVLSQISVADSRLPSARWDLSVSLVHDGEVTRELSGMVRGGGSGEPVVLEHRERIEPGRYALVAVAQEASTELTASGLHPTSWPDPDEAGAVVAPPAILQPGAGSFDREGTTRSSGNLALFEDDLASRDRPLALVGLVCRPAKESQPLRVERHLEGEAVVAFEPFVLSPDEDRCAQVRDLIPPGTLGEGHFRYDIVVLRGDEVLARGARAFRVGAEPGSEALPSSFEPR